MLKERFEKTKKFVKEHKEEFIVGGLVIAGSLIGVKLVKNCIDEKTEVQKIKKNDQQLYIEAYNRATDIANDYLIPDINDKYDDFSNYETDPEHSRLYDEYNREYETRWNEILNNELDKVGL